MSGLSVPADVVYLINWSSVFGGIIKLPISYLRDDGITFVAWTATKNVP